MTDGFVLFAHWQMRLTVFMGLGPECRGVLATQTRLSIEVMGLLSTLIHKIFAQVQIALFTRHSIQLDQREFDLFMPRVAALLA